MPWPKNTPLPKRQRAQIATKLRAHQRTDKHRAHFQQGHEVGLPMAAKGTAVNQKSRRGRHA